MSGHRMPLVLLLVGLVLASSANASVVYDIQSSLEHLHISFELPGFQQTVSNQTVFNVETWDLPLPITNFTLSGGTAACSVGGPSGPCWAASGGANSANTLVSPLFNGPGTFSATSLGVTTNVTITQITSTPEPPPAILVSGTLLGFVIVVVKRRFTRPRTGV